MTRLPQERLPHRARARAACAAVAIALMLGALPAAATLYKWTDAGGRVVYSDQPPPGGVRYEVVGTATPPDNPAAVRDMANKDLELRKLQRERVEEAKKADKARADSAKRADICSQARAAVRTYQVEGDQLYTTNEKGERKPLDAAERQRRMAEQQRLVKEYCTT